MVQIYMILNHKWAKISIKISYHKHQKLGDLEEQKHEPSQLGHHRDDGFQNTLKIMEEN